MSIGYQAVGWNRQKNLYDRYLWLGILLFLATFVGISLLKQPSATLETVLIRAFGAAALTLLHLILITGPLCRLDARFLPLLYNRRHMGVSMFCLGLVHGGFALFQFHALGDMNPFVSLFAGSGGYVGLSSFPFQPLGFFALVILFLMAATSHDFWLTHLTAPVWKALHMGVYLAYALLVAHVLLGTLQVERNPLPTILLGLGLVLVVGLHLLAGRKGRLLGAEQIHQDGYLNVCAPHEIPMDRAKIVSLSGERVALFRHKDGISAVSNVCQHQNGPLGEGKIIDGCITCPWHGYQYRPQDGASPEPFTEKVPTFKVRIAQNRVWVHPLPNRPGTWVDPAPFPADAGTGDDHFYVGYLPKAPEALGRWLRPRVAMLVLAGPVLGWALAVSQGQAGPGDFEFGKLRSFEGVFLNQPYPLVRVKRPGQTQNQPDHSLYLLTVFGKKGAEAVTAGRENQQVRFSGSLIYRDNQVMIEVQPDSVEELGPAPAAPAGQSLGDLDVCGEIIDSKCFLGVMKPGNTLTHKGCAIRCISGGVPPVLLVRDPEGLAHYFLLVDEKGEAVNRRVLDLVAEPIQIKGEVIQRDNLYYLSASPSTYRRLGTDNEQE